jgi:hypothetical protein
MKYKFRGYYTGGHEGSGRWVYGNLIEDKRGVYIFNFEKLPKSFKVFRESVGMMWKDEIYEGDIFTVDQYPFFSDGENNYVGIIEYVPDDGFCGWYYGVQAVSNRVRGGACGGGLADLEGLEIKVLGSKYHNPELLRVR